MAFQSDHVPGLEASKQDGDQQPLLFSGPRGVAVRILSRAESSDYKIEKLIELEMRMSEWSNYDRALLIELVYGTLRWQARLDWVLTGFYHGEFTKCIVPVKNAMRVALYQILMLSKIPPSVAVNECASTIRRIKDDKSANIVAGVLKNILRNVEGIRYPSKEDNIQLFYSVTLSHPLWIVKRWCERYGEEQAEKILSANNERPNIYLCANRLKWDGSAMPTWLKEHECTFEAVPGYPDIVRINGLQNVMAMEMVNDGRAFVCSASDFQVARLANISSSDTVLCLGASQSFLLLAINAVSKNAAKTYAVSNFESIIPRMESRLKILGFSNTQVISSSAKELETLSANVVVVEAPVSGLGLLNIRPELRWKIELDAIRKSALQQKAAIVDAATHVQAGGVLIYCAQSFEKEETVDIVEWFIAEHPEFSLEDASPYCDAESVVDGKVQCRLSQQKIDNLFAARLRRRS